MISGLSAVAGGFWLLAETVIALSVSWLEVRIAGRSWRESILRYAAVFCVGAFLILRGPAFFAGFGSPPFGRKLAWNLLCAIWIVLEWAILAHLQGAIIEARVRFLSFVTAPKMSRRITPVSLGIVVAAIAWHRFPEAAWSDPAGIEFRAYLFVRAAGFVYIALEAAIAWQLWRARILVRELLAR